ncbi:MAG: hypothetical protein PHO46_00870 [Thermoguttaceae bacterium]|nr:hypothetical protein [Thermoguttaceae bacterium]
MVESVIFEPSESECKVLLEKQLKNEGALFVAGKDLAINMSQFGCNMSFKRNYNTRRHEGSANLAASIKLRYPEQTFSDSPTPVR